MRVKADFNTEVSQFVASGDKQQSVTLTASDEARRKCLDKGLSVEPQTVRLIRITVKKKVYFLMTNLLDTQRYPVQAFKALYHARWQIEEGKSRYQVNFAQALLTMKDTIVTCLYGLLSMQEYRQLVETMRQSLTIIRPGRGFVRKQRRGYQQEMSFLLQKNVVITRNWT